MCVYHYIFMTSSKRKFTVLLFFFLEILFFILTLLKKYRYINYKLLILLKTNAYHVLAQYINSLPCVCPYIFCQIISTHITVLKPVVFSLRYPFPSAFYNNFQCVHTHCSFSLYALTFSLASWLLCYFQIFDHNPVSR